MAEMTRRLTTAQATLGFLASQFVERDGLETPLIAGVLGILGHGNVAGIGEALASGGSGLRFVQGRNEQAMVHVAVGYARQRLRLSTFACTTSVGPGATNLVTGAAAATVNRLPVLLLPGDVFASRRAGTVLQQLERSPGGDVSANDTLRPVSRFWDRIQRPEQLIPSLLEAMRVLTSPVETGAVTIALPQDVQAEAAEFPDAFLDRRVWHIDRPRPSDTALDRAMAMILASERPLMICGGGVIYSDASAALVALADATGVPVVETQAGRGALSWRHPSNVGPVGPNGGLAGNTLARDADLVIGVGTRLTDFTTSSLTAFQASSVSFIGVNIDPSDAAKLSSTPLIGDARTTIEALTVELVRQGWRVSSGYAEAVQELRARWTDEVQRLREPGPAEDRITQAEVIRIVNEGASDEDILVAAAGSLPGDLSKLWRADRPGTYHVEYGFSTMGYEIAGGLGARMAVAKGLGRVIVMVGDGSWLMLSSEIVTSIQEHQPLTVVLIDNHGFGSIHGLSRQLGGRDEFNRSRVRDPGSGAPGTADLDIDLVANAASLGADAIRVATPDELRVALETARNATRTTVIVVEVDMDLRLPTFGAWWDVPVAEVSDSEDVRAARAAYEIGRAAQRGYT